MMELFPISVRLTGVLIKAKSKLYITSVLWSDHTEVVVYRSLDDFRKTHKELKKTFSSGSKVNKSERILPRLQGKKIKQRSQGKGPNKSLVCLKYLQRYCDELLSCDQRVCQSAELVKFLQAKEQELQPVFTKNSITITPSEDELMAGRGQSTNGDVTQPFVTETYSCVAPYETKDTKGKPFKVALNEKLDVLIKDKGGWWLVENEDKKMAWFPAPYLEKPGEEEVEEETEDIPEHGPLYTTVKSHDSSKVDEISVTVGAMVEVLQKKETGWWLVRHNGKVGFVPALCLKPRRQPYIHMTSHRLDSNSSSAFLTPLSNMSHSSSHGNLLQIPPPRASLPDTSQVEGMHRSVSLNALSEALYAQSSGHNDPVTRDTSAAASTGPAFRPPIITVQPDDDEHQSSRRRSDFEDSFESDSFSDETISISGGSSLNLSYGADPARPSRTPPPVPVKCFSPPSKLEGGLASSVSDPNIYEGPRSPKVPPRPRVNEILTRCTTLTRQKAAKSTQTPTQTEIMSR